MDELNGFNRVPDKYHERHNGMASSYRGTSDVGISTNDDDEIIVSVPEDGNYMLLAKGSYLGHAYCIVDVVLYIYSVENNRQLGRQVIATNYNYQGLISMPVKFILKEKLCKGERVELRFGNINHSPGAPDAQQSFSYAAPGDYLALIKLP